MIHHITVDFQVTDEQYDKLAELAWRWNVRMLSSMTAESFLEMILQEGSRHLIDSKLDLWGGIIASATSEK